MTMRALALSLATILTTTGFAAAQRPGFQPVVVTPQNYNPYVLRATTPPPLTAYVPGQYTPSAIVPGPWGNPMVIPGNYTPPTVVQQVPGRYLSLPDGRMYNPWTGSLYSRFTDRFDGPNGGYGYNPWTGTYTNSFTGESFNPRSGTLVRPVPGPVVTPGGVIYR